MNICSVCSAPAKAKGMCRKHYLASWRVKNRKRMSDYQKEYYRKHPEKFLYRPPKTEKKRLHINARNAAWRAKNIEKARAIQSAYYKKHAKKLLANVSLDRVNNPDKYKTMQAKYYKNNRKKILRRLRENYKTNSGPFAKKNIAWCKANPKAVVARAARYRARKLSAEGNYVARDIKDMYEKQEGKCNLCGVELGNKYDVDHIFPLSLGGSNWPTNIQLLCVSCNRSKSNKIPDQLHPPHGSNNDNIR